jgi:hypothetical protein
VHSCYYDKQVFYLAISCYFSYSGGASTLQRGIVKTMTRGVNLDKSDFSGIEADMFLIDWISAAISTIEFITK